MNYKVTIETKSIKNTFFIQADDMIKAKTKAYQRFWNQWSPEMLYRSTELEIINIEETLGQYEVIFYSEENDYSYIVEAGNKRMAQKIAEDKFKSEYPKEYNDCEDYIVIDIYKIEEGY